MLHFLKFRIGVKGKIGVYGRSIGCTAACKVTPYIDMIIADRGFTDLWTLAEKKFFDPVSSVLVKYGTQGW